MKARFQIAVIGSGFGGSLMAMMAHRLGFSTVLIERGRHPRFAIGESSAPLANLLLEEIARDYDLPFVRPLCKWGTWQKELPHLACGIKRGFTFYHHEWGRPFRPDPERQRQLLVGASPNETIADTHWYRADFDHYLVEQARKIGVAYLDDSDLSSISENSTGMRLEGKRGGKSIGITAGFVIDATGPRGCLFRALGLRERRLREFPRTQALFSHFRGVGPLTNAFANWEEPPYPPEQAAVHHVFPGGWIWVLKFNNGISSAGVAATDKIARAMKFSTGESGWRQLLQLLPSLAEMFADAKNVVPFVASTSLSFRAGAAAGSRWVLLPSAVGFVDPLLSTGFPLTLLGITRIGRMLREHWGQPSFRSELTAYSRLTLLELDAAARLVGALYATMDRFDLFKDLTFLYFAAASFSETARRLGKPHLADSFLLCRNSAFDRQLRSFCARARQPLSSREIGKLCREIRRAIEPFDVAGLTENRRHPWYPALADDLLRGAPKLEASKEEIAEVLKRCGFNNS
jgi:FADH2 O2-dependent halogenase